MTVCFDLDGTLCTNTYGAYDEAEPFPWAIERLNALAAAGHRIVVFTARGTATGIDWAETTRGQLDRWGVRYDALQLGKPSADVYVDDRAVHTTAWREGDALAVPGFGLPPLAGPERAEQLPGILAPQRSVIVESGRTYDGRPFLAGEHVERALAVAAAAGLSGLPDSGEVTQALDRALDGAAGAGDVVFSILLADAVSPAFLDVSEERTQGPLVTVRTLEQAARGLAERTPGHPLGGRMGAVIDGRLALAALPERPPPLSALVEELARDAGVEMAASPLEPGQAAQAQEAFEAVTPFGLLSIGEAGGPVRARLAGALSERVGLDVDAQLAEVLG